MGESGREWEEEWEEEWTRLRFGVVHATRKYRGEERRPGAHDMYVNCNTCLTFYF